MPHGTLDAHATDLTDLVASCYQLALAARRAGDRHSAEAILRELVTNDAADRTARTLLALEIAGRARTDDDLRVIGELVLDDFYLVDALGPLLRALVTDDDQALVDVPVETAGLSFGWPLDPDRTGYALLYDWLPRFHNTLEAAAAAYRDYASYEGPNVARAERLAQFFLGWLDIPVGARVLDAGCGAGELIDAFARACPIEAHGVDMAAEAGPLACARVPGLTFSAGDLAALAYPDDHFDVIVCTDVLEHLRHPATVLAELVRTLRPGGVLAVSVPDGRWDTYMGHVNFFSSVSLEALLEPFGHVELGICRDGLAALVHLPDR